MLIDSYIHVRFIYPHIYCGRGCPSGSKRQSFSAVWVCTSAPSRLYAPVYLRGCASIRVCFPAQSREPPSIVFGLSYSRCPTIYLLPASLSSKSHRSRIWLRNDSMGRALRVSWTDNRKHGSKKTEANVGVFGQLGNAHLPTSFALSLPPLYLHCHGCYYFDTESPSTNDEGPGIHCQRIPARTQKQHREQKYKLHRRLNLNCAHEQSKKCEMVRAGHWACLRRPPLGSRWLYFASFTVLLVKNPYSVRPGNYAFRLADWRVASRRWPYRSCEEKPE